MPVINFKVLFELEKVAILILNHKSEENEHLKTAGTVVSNITQISQLRLT